MTVSLRELQEQFQAYVLDQQSVILNSISQMEESAIERIDIYREGYVLRLLEILEKDFPFFRKYITDSTFEELARAYIQAHPSNHFSICMFSRHFSHYLSLAGRPSHWSEMATFEQAIAAALDAADAPHLTVEGLSTLAQEAWPIVRFTLHPSLTTYKFQTNAPKILYAVMYEEALPAVEDSAAIPNWIVWRHLRSSYFESIANEQLWIFNAIMQQKNFSEICDGLCEWLSEEEVIPYVAGSLRHWIEKGIISSFEV